MKYAIVDGTTVKNIIVWDGVTPLDLGSMTAIQIVPTEFCEPGAIYRVGQTPRFVRPAN